MAETDSVWQALEAGKVLLHPTDSLPGLGFYPKHPEAPKKLAAIKGRDPSQPLNGIVANLDQALRFWQPIGSSWQKALQEIWPAPLTVVAPSRDPIPALQGRESTLALRVPLFSQPEIGQWLMDLVSKIGLPLPTTSCNAHGKPAATDWQEAVEFAKTNPSIFVPKLPCPPHFGGNASTMIAVTGSDSYRVLRTGAISPEELQASLAPWEIHEA